MLWDAASCRVMRMAAISVYCDDCGHNLSCCGGRRSLLSQTTSAPDFKLPLQLGAAIDICCGHSFTHILLKVPMICQ